MPHFKVIALAGVTAAMFSPLYGAEIVVRSGDTLSGIAARELGAENRWFELCELNRSKLPDCSRLSVGMSIALPRQVSEAAPQAESKESGETSSDLQKPQELSGPVSENLISLSDVSSSSTWRGYYLKPAIEEGVTDSNGGNEAVRLLPADSKTSPGGVISGIYRQGNLPAGRYIVSVWARSVGGEIAVQFGLADGYTSGPKALNEEWQFLETEFVVETPISRSFQIFERELGNPAWEIFGASVTRAE